VRALASLPCSEIVFLKETLEITDNLSKSLFFILSEMALYSTLLFRSLEG
jgi:hypothetical protein